jgi:hypothetical protein
MMWCSAPGASVLVFSDALSVTPPSVRVKHKIQTPGPVRGRLYVLARRYILAFGLEAASAEINGLPTTCAFTRAVKFVGEDFHFFAAFRALADKGT